MRFLIPFFCFSALIFPLSSNEWVSDVSDHIDFILRDLCLTESLKPEVSTLKVAPKKAMEAYLVKAAGGVPKSSWVLTLGAAPESLKKRLSHTCYFSQGSDLAGGCQKEGHFQCSPDEIPVPDGVFDAIFCFEALGDFLQPQKILRECRRILKPGGRLFIVAPGEAFYRPKYYTDFSEEWYRAALASADLSFVARDLFGQKMQRLSSEAFHLVSDWKNTRKHIPKAYQELMQRLFGEMLPRVFYDFSRLYPGLDAQLGYVVKAAKLDPKITLKQSLRQNLPQKQVKP